MKITKQTEAEEIKEEKPKKKKKPNFFDKSFKKQRLKKPNMVAVLFLRNNGNADPMEVEVKKGFFNIEGRAYHQRRDCTFTVTKDRLPLAIIPEWSMVPYGTQVWEEKPMLEKYAELQDHLLRGIRHAELVRLGDKEPMNANMKKAIAIVVLAIVVLAIVFQNI